MLSVKHEGLNGMKLAELEADKAKFEKEILALDDAALVDRRIAFDAQPAATPEESEMRLLQSLTLEAVLQQRFGLVAYNIIAARKKEIDDA